MEQKAPRLSSASLVAGCLLVAFSIINSTANLALENGLSLEEFIALGVAMPAFLISYFASRERPIPELVNQLSIQVLSSVAAICAPSDVAMPCSR